MHSLAELQRNMAEAIVGGDCTVLDAELRGGADPRLRFAIHRRHYAASLAAALRQKFPACCWLLGAELVTAAAREYIRAQPPQQPCIADYGSTFPSFLAGAARELQLPYLEAFASLEWAVGRASIAIDLPRVTWTDLADLGIARLLESRLTLQPGLHYLRFGWAVDELLTAYLRDAAPELFALAELDVPLEVRGARGTLSLKRLEPGTFAFRAALAAGETIGDSAALALGVDAAFGAGDELQRLVAEGLVAASASTPEGAR